MPTIATEISLTDRIALVTGAAGHLGIIIAEALIELGAFVILSDKNIDNLDRAQQSLRSAFPAAGIDILPLDLQDSRAVTTVIPQYLSHRPRLDILVNCAAFVADSSLDGWTVPFAEQSLTAWRECLELNVTAPFLLTQLCHPFLHRSGRGSVINIASIYGLVGPDHSLYVNTSMGNPAAYAASKGALIQLTRWLATTLAPTIRVNSITLGGLDRAQPKAFKERYIAKTPLRRMGCENDIKGAIAYLASDLSGYVTGQNQIIDGGWTTW